MSAIELFLLPGFLGEARDFDAFRAEMEKLAPAVRTEAVDWMDEASWLADEEFETLGEALARELQRRARPGARIAVLGYSLGGRMALALHEHLRAHGDQATDFVFVSVNPGLADAGEREARLKADAQWAGRFRSEEWTKLMTDWNAQAVFQGSVNEPDRSRRKGQRDLLAKALMRWSLARQPDHRGRLVETGDFLWITGARDAKFTGLAQGLPNAKTIPTASHRVHLDAPAELARMVSGYLTSKK